MVGDSQLWVVGAAELLFVVAQGRSIAAVAKSPRQRTDQEQYEVDRGLWRSLLLEAMVFVPASALLLYLIAPLWVPDEWLAAGKARATYAVMGLISYGFPYAAVRHLFTRVALKLLEEFAAVLPKDSPDSKKHRQKNLKGQESVE